jgi:hypothetical protein
VKQIREVIVMSNRQPDRAYEPYCPAGPEGRAGASDRWARRLANGIQAFATLWFTSNRDFPFYFDIIFKARGNQNIEVGKIADEIMAVLDRRGVVIQWERREGGESVMGAFLMVPISDVLAGLIEEDRHRVTINVQGKGVKYEEELGFQGEEVITRVPRGMTARQVICGEAAE